MKIGDDVINLEGTEDEEAAEGQVKTTRKHGGNLLSFFSGKSKARKEPLQQQPVAKKRKSQVDENFCVYDNCHKTISRKDVWTKKRHASSCHKGDPKYDFNK